MSGELRVLRVSHSAVVGEWRGRERALRALGHTVRLLSARSWDEGGRAVPLEPDPGEDVVGVRTIGTHPNVFLYDPRPVWRALGEPWDVIDLHEEPCALATAEILALRALRRVRTPYVLYSAQNIAKRYPVPFRWWERRALRGAGAVSVCNGEAGRILADKGLTAPARVIGLGVDVGRFAPGPARPTTGPVVVGYVGRLAAHKGVGTLLDAAALDDRLHVRIAGGGPQEDELRSAAARPDLAGRVTFVGHLAQDELADFYRELDVLAVPSVPTPGWLEQFCRVAVEAMASGVVVVASASGALPEVVADAGMLVPPSDARALADALASVRDDPERAAGLRRRGLLRARGYSWQQIGAQYHAMYAEVLDPSGADADAASTDTVAPVHGGAQVHGGVPAGRGIAVVVVAYGSPGLLRESLAPLAGHLPLTVVDNSSDPAVRSVAADAGADYLDPGANLGFAGAVNLALAHRRAPRAASPPGAAEDADAAEDVLLLNPDARIELEDVLALQRRLHAHPRTGAVGPAQVDASGHPGQVLWPFPSPFGTWMQAVGLGRVFERRHADRFVIGSVLLLRSEAVDEVGGFDDSFFLYSEETDWQLRARAAGWDASLAPDVVALHLGGATSADPVRRETHFHASQERYLRKHFGSRGWSAARAAVVLGGAGRAVLPGDRGRSARLRVRLYVRGPLRAEASLPRLVDVASPRPSKGTP